METSLEQLSTRELFGLYRRILQELTRRNIVRTMNAPAGDYAEYLVAALMEGELADNSEKSWDLKTPDGTRLQVKCRVVDVTKKNHGRQLSPFRTWDFDRAIVVLFDESYGVHKCVAFPPEVLKEHGKYRLHVNGHVVQVTDSLMAHPSAEDMTEALRGVSTSL